VQQNAHQNEDDFYEDLIPKLYKPVKQKKVVEVLTQELPFEVEKAPEPEPAVEETQQAENGKQPVDKGESDEGKQPVDEGQSGDSQVTEGPATPTALDKLKEWLRNLMKDVTE